MEPKNSTNRIKTSIIPEIKKDMKALAKKAPEESSLKDVIRQTLPEIHDIRAAGHSFDDIAGMLNRYGLKVTGSTLSSYVRDEMRAQKRKNAGQDVEHFSDEMAVPDMVEADVPRVTVAARQTIVFEDITDDPEEPDQIDAAAAEARRQTAADSSALQLSEELSALLADTADDDLTEE